MDAPQKDYVTTKGKSNPLPLKKGKSTTNPTSSDGNTKASMGVDALHNAQGSKGKYC